MLRGFAMLAMAFEHTSFYSQTNILAATFSNSKRAYSSVLHIIIGLITNEAPEIFFFLVGTSVAFFENSRRKQGWSERQITSFLLIRALIIAVLDRVVSHFGWYQSILTFDVLSAIAFGMAILAFVRLLAVRDVAIIAIILFFAYPLLVTTFPLNLNNPLSTATAFLYQFHNETSPHIEFAALSRLSLILMGYVAGRLLVDKKVTINDNVFWLALAFLIAAGVLRILGGYGNFSPYDPTQPFIYFFIESKQPPSVVYLLFNMAKSLIILGILGQITNHFPNSILERGLVLLGQTSLFFYVVHIVLLSNLIVRIIPPTFLGEDSLPREFLMYALLMALMIPLCIGYRELRKRYPKSVLKYL